jgi:hypothetical protein
MADCEAPARSDTRGRLEKHFLPKFVDRLVSGLTKSDLGGWLTSTVVESLMIPNVFDVPKCANRVLSMIKAWRLDELMTIVSVSLEYRQTETPPCAGSAGSTF